jgi:tetraprenyl-beta-curcumene synthase
VGTQTIEREPVGAAGALAFTALNYSLTILPVATRELVTWRVRAGQIPDPVLRELALQALRKRGNMLGGALFAVLAPRRRRSEVVHALVAFQSAYNYLDTLVEQPSADPVGNGRRLHNALLLALQPEAVQRDYYAGYPRHDDGGLLNAMVEACRGSLLVLPSYELVADPVQRAAERIVDFQSLNLGVRQGDDDGLERWARSSTPPGSGLRWWETAAAGGSSLVVHALVALAARPALDSSHVAAIEDAYFPWVGALHSLLDSMIDLVEDERDGQRSLIGYYASPQDAAARMRSLATRAAQATETLPGGRQHRAILSAMTGHYLSAPGASLAQARLLAEGVAEATGAPARPARALSRAAGLISRRAGPRG